MTYSLYGATIKSVSSSDKSVATVKKDSSAKYRSIIDFKKAGSANIKIRSSSRTDTLKLKLKDASSSFTADMITVPKTSSYSSNNEFYISLKNDSSINFSSAKLYYELYNTSGELAKAENVSISNVLAKKTSYSYSQYYTDSDSIDVSKTKIYITDLVRFSYSNNYKSLSSKKYSVKSSVSTDSNGYNSVTITATNKTSKQAIVVVTLTVKDSSGAIRSISSRSIYLSKNETEPVTISPSVKPEDWGSYTVTSAAVYH